MAKSENVKQSTQQAALYAEVESHRGYLLRFATAKLRDGDQAEEVVQEALLAALEGVGSFAGQSSLRTWLTSILKFKIIDVLRSRGREVRLQAAELPTVQADAAVAHVVSERAQAAALRPTPPLDEAEALFVAAFAAGAAKSGPRAGQGLDWDSPGFTPPGGPARR